MQSGCCKKYMFEATKYFALKSNNFPDTAVSILFYK